MQENDASDTITTTTTSTLTENSARQFSKQPQTESINTRTMFFQPPPWVWTKTTTSSTPVPIEQSNPNAISNTNEPNVTSYIEQQKSGDASSIIQTSTASSLPQIDYDNGSNNNNNVAIPLNRADSSGQTNSNTLIATSGISTNDSFNINQQHQSSLVEIQPNELVTKSKITSLEHQPNLQQQSSASPINNQNQAQPYKKGTIVASATSSPIKGFLTNRIMMPQHTSSSSSLNRNNHLADSKQTNSKLSDVPSQQQSASSASSSILKTSAGRTIQMIVIATSILLANFFISFNPSKIINNNIQ